MAAESNAYARSGWSQGLPQSNNSAEYNTHSSNKVSVAAKGTMGHVSMANKHRSRVVNCVMSSVSSMVSHSSSSAALKVSMALLLEVAAIVEELVLLLAFGSRGTLDPSVVELLLLFWLPWEVLLLVLPSFGGKVK